MDLREVPWAANITAGEEPAFLVKFLEQGLWKGADAWTGAFHPVNGLLMEATPYVGILLRYYEVLPSWLVIAVVSLLARSFMYEFSIP